MSNVAFVTAVPLTSKSSLPSCNSLHHRHHHRPIQLASPKRRKSPLYHNHQLKTTASSTPSSTTQATPTKIPSQNLKSPIPTANPRASYDYVIIGGGAAGCVLANRLSKNPSHKILLLESGPSAQSFLLNMPLGFPKLLGSSLDSAYTTHPEPNLNGRRLYFPRGKLLGGSHAISVMLYHRGAASDYEYWKQVTGDDGWGPESVLNYFKKSERQSNIEKLRNRDVHGDQGCLPVDDLRFVNPMAKAFVDAAVGNGLGKNDDFNDWSTDQEGAGLFQVTQKEGNRATPANSYLDPVRSRSNLTVMSGCTVERMILSEDTCENPEATGVVFVDNQGRRSTVSASREIILSAGVYGSPQLLMLSGIGPGNHLQSMNIQVVKDNDEVGTNLQDHAATMLTYHSKNPFTDKKKSSVFYTEETGKNPNIIMNYLLNGRGPLTSPMCEAGAFVRTNADLKSCDLQIRFVPFFSEADPYRSLADFANGGTYLRNEANRPAGFSLQSVVTRPLSKGFVKLRSIDVRDSMEIHANWMSQQGDINTLVSGLKICRDIANHPSFNEYRGVEMYPGDKCSSDEDLIEYVKGSCHTANAMVGTCAMGNVVDGDLKVKGVNRLRVIDSSVMPSLPGGQSGAPTMMIAERGADLIIRDNTPARTIPSSSLSSSSS